MGTLVPADTPTGSIRNTRRMRSNLLFERELNRLQKEGQHQSVRLLELLRLIGLQFFDCVL